MNLKALFVARTALVQCPPHNSILLDTITNQRLILPEDQSLKPESSWRPPAGPGCRERSRQSVAAQALRARDWFAINGPPDAPQLPVSGYDIADMKRQHSAPNPALNHIVARFAVSLQGQAWDFSRHPRFDDFARALMAAKNAPDFVVKDETMLRRYRRLAKLMGELGWTAVRVRGLTRGGYLEQVRGFARVGRVMH